MDSTECNRLEQEILDEVSANRVASSARTLTSFASVSEGLQLTVICCNAFCPKRKPL
jgi:hypothetical protein